MPMKKSGLFRNKNAKATPYKNKGVTEVGKEAKTHSYKEYVQKMFGGGMMSPQPITAQKPPFTGASKDPRLVYRPRPPIGKPGTLAKRAPTQLIDPGLPRGKVGKGPLEPRDSTTRVPADTKNVRKGLARMVGLSKGPGMKAGGKTKKMGMGGISSIPFGSGPTKLRNRNQDPILPRGKKGRGDI
jgi:hypothetical protein